MSPPKTRYMDASSCSFRPIESVLLRTDTAISTVSSSSFRCKFDMKKVYVCNTQHTCDTLNTLGHLLARSFQEMKTDMTRSEVLSTSPSRSAFKSFGLTSFTGVIKTIGSR